MNSLITGFLLSGVNPKNLLLVATGANIIDTSMLPATEQAGALIVFTAIASATIAIPVAGHLFFVEQAEALFCHWKDWLIRNNATVLVSLLLVFGLLLSVGGMRILTS